ncbi:MAG: ATP-grasp domain-containing protein [Desulfitobacteriaceae bacterium]|nr:ATP-grasp domain-containing protein [Desulfitobacteriaceae bacterium]
MKTIIFLGTHKSGSGREALKASARLGYYTVLYTNQPKFLENRTSFPDVHLMYLCDLNNLEEIKLNIRHLILNGIEICAVVSFIEPYCHTACQIADFFSVNRFSTQAIKIMLDKILSRQILAKSSYNPKFTILAKKDLSLSSLPLKIKKNYPFILKLPHSQGSKDVFKINNAEQYKHYVKKISQKSQDPILVEEFLDGPQYLVEVLVRQNKIHIVAIVQQEITHSKRFIITGYKLLIDPPADFFENLKEAVEAIVQRHGMETGACHLELRHVWKKKAVPVINEDNDYKHLQKKKWKLVEINPRISGGSMNRLIEIGLGINLVEETLKLALGQEPNLLPSHKQNVFAQYLILSETGILEKITGRKKASVCPGVEEVFLRPRKGTLLIPPLSMGHRYAYVIAKGDNEEMARQNAKYAVSQIKFWLSAPSEQPDNEQSQPNL